MTIYTHLLINCAYCLTFLTPGSPYVVTVTVAVYSGAVTKACMTPHFLLNPTNCLHIMQNMGCTLSTASHKK